MQLHNLENRTNRREEIETDLTNFAEQLKTSNIKIVFVTTPVTAGYYKFCNKKILDQNTNFINDLCKKYNAVYLNFFVDKRFILNDFYDNDHLKNNGANKLSKLINDTLTKH